MLPEDDADAFIQQEIRQGILAMMEEHKELKRRDKKMENQVNNLDETLHKMADEKGYISEENDDYLRIYPNKDSKIRNYVEFWFNKDEDSNKAASVTAHHE